MPTVDPNSVLMTISEMAATYIDGDIKPTMTLDACNFDSLDVEELTMLLEQEFDIEIEHAKWSIDTTIQEIIDDLQKLAARS